MTGALDIAGGWLRAAGEEGERSSRHPTLRQLSASREQILIEAVLRGDETAARTLYDQHAQRVHRLCHRLVADPSLAEECVQEAFLRAFESLPSFEGRARFGTWLHRIAVSAAYDGLRRQQRRARMESKGSAPEVAVHARRRDPMLREKLVAALDSLPEIYRDAFVLYHLEDRSHHEISRLLGIPVGTSKRRVSDARRMLQHQLQETLGDSP